jgi:hypothetical protein
MFKRIIATALLAGAVTTALPATQALAGSVTVPVPIIDCEYTVSWDVDARDPLATDADTYGTCEG